MIGSAPTPRRRGIPLLLAAVQIILTLAALSRYDSTSYVFRGTNAVDAFNALWRIRIGDAVSLFDLILLAFFGVIAAHATFVGRVRKSPFDAVAATLIVLIVVSSLLKPLFVGPQDQVKDWLFMVRNYAYFLAAYMAASRIQMSELRYQKLLKLVVWLAVATIGLSMWEYSAIPDHIGKYGRIAFSRDVDDFLFIFFVLFWLVALWLDQPPANRLTQVLMLACIAYGLFTGIAGASKSTLIVYPVVLGYYAKVYRLYLRHWFRVLVAAVVIVGIPALVFGVSRLSSLDQTSPLYIFTTFNSEDVSFGTRVLETANFGLNMVNRNAELFGIGPGGKWREYVPQLKNDTGAFPLDEIMSDWHLNMHMPLMRLGLDFGLVGLGMLLYVFYRCFRTMARYSRSRDLTPLTRAFLQASIVTVCYQLIVSNLADPKTNTLAGVLMGAASALIAHARRLERGAAPTAGPAEADQ